MHLLRNISIRVNVLIAPVIMIVALGLVLLIAIQGMENQLDGSVQVCQTNGLIYRIKFPI